MTVEYVSWQQFAMFSSPSTAYTEEGTKPHGSADELHEPWVAVTPAPFFCI